MRVRTSATVGVAALILAALAACGGSPAGAGTAAGSPSGTPVASPATPSGGAEASATGVATPTSKPTSTRPTAKSTTGPSLGCRSIDNAVVGNATVPLEDIPGEVVQLFDGRWTTADLELELEGTCGTGHLDDDGALDAVSAVVLNGGGTGRFYTLVAWTGDGGRPRLVASKALGDRTPVESITISASTHRITVVYLTRGADMPATALDVRRTAVYRISGNRLVEVSHVDAPYRP